MTTTRGIPSIEQSSYHYFECIICGFDSVQPADYDGSAICPLCAGDNGHCNVMTRRVARDSDDPEGHDARILRNTSSDHRINTKGAMDDKD